MLHQLGLRLLGIDQEYLAILAAAGHYLILLWTDVLLWFMLTELTIPRWYVKLLIGLRDSKEWIVMLLLQETTSALMGYYLI